MPIQVACPGCSKQFRVADEHAGKKVKCPGCQTVFQVPQPHVEAPLPNFAAAPSTPTPQFDPLAGMGAGQGGAQYPDPIYRPNPYASPTAEVGKQSTLSANEQTMGNLGLAFGIVALVGEFISGMALCCCGIFLSFVPVLVIPVAGALAGVGLFLSSKSAGGLKLAGMIVNGIAVGIAVAAVVLFLVIFLLYGGLLAFSLSQQNQGGGI